MSKPARLCHTNPEYLHNLAICIVATFFFYIITFVVFLVCCYILFTMQTYFWLNNKSDINVFIFLTDWQILKIKSLWKCFCLQDQNLDFWNATTIRL